MSPNDFLNDEEVVVINWDESESYYDPYQYGRWNDIDIPHVMNEFGGAFGIMEFPTRPVSRNLVLVTHGWLSSADDDGEWPVLMRNQIEVQINADLEQVRRDKAVEVGHESWSHNDMDLTHISGPDAEEIWEVVSLDWKSQARTLTPNRARVKAIHIAGNIGRMIRDYGYDSVQLIGHSAGAWLIDGIADVLDATQTDIHVTFLDAFTPEGFANDLGDGSYWAESTTFTETCPLIRTSVIRPQTPMHYWSTHTTLI